MQPGHDAVEQIAEPQPRASVKAWATRHGLLPQWTDSPTVSHSAANRVNPNFWKLAAAQARFGWTLDTELTEQEFADGVATVADVQLR